MMIMLMPMTTMMMMMMMMADNNDCNNSYYNFNKSNKKILITAITVITLSGISIISFSYVALFYPELLHLYCHYPPLLCYPVPHASAPNPAPAPAFLSCALVIINVLIYPDFFSIFFFFFSL